MKKQAEVLPRSPVTTEGRALLGLALRNKAPSPSN